jgi:uncharacterized membrane-anchored protein
MKQKKSFLQKHWMDILAILGVCALLALLAYSIYHRFNFAKKWGIFWNYFVVNRGYGTCTSDISAKNGVEQGGLAHTGVAR